MPKEKPMPTGTDAQLAEILEHLRRLDHRDKLRTQWGFFRGIIALIPLIFLLWSAWYFTTHFAEVMKTVADQAAKSAASYTQEQGSSMFDQFMKQYSIPSQKK